MFQINKNTTLIRIANTLYN